MHKNIAIFISGKGSNAIEFMKQESQFNYRVALLVSTITSSPALDFAKENKVATYTLEKEDFLQEELLLKLLEDHQIELTVLAGFLWKIPEYLINKYPKGIVNIHPSLLPKFGGKGMYGMHVHRAVHQHQEEESGISIHWVNEQYDEGALIFQAKINLSREDSPEMIAEKVLRLEHQHYPRVVHELCKSF